MRLPRDLSGGELVKLLAKLGYSVTRQKGSHIRVTTDLNGEHHITIPDHDSLKIGTLSDILKSVADHLNLEREELLDRLLN
jgi:predicted RNA binding protein YcfA (HicA-like mRNA interferase family)